MHLGADTSQTAVRPPVTSHLTASDYALAVFELTADVYPCLDFEEEGLDMGYADANIEICAHMRRFLEPPGWLFPYAVSNETDLLRKDDEKCVPEMI